MEERLHSIAATMLRIPVSRSTLYGLISSGQLASTKVGGRRFVSESSINNYIASLAADPSPNRSDADVPA